MIVADGHVIGLVADGPDAKGEFLDVESLNDQVMPAAGIDARSTLEDGVRVLVGVTGIPRPDVKAVRVFVQNVLAGPVQN